MRSFSRSTRLRVEEIKSPFWTCACAKHAYATTDNPRLLLDPDAASIRRLTLTSIS
jgi:hypothetical protein